MSLKQLTREMCMLLALLTGRRKQALHLLQVGDLKLHDTKCIKFFSDKHKHSRHRISGDISFKWKLEVVPYEAPEGQKTSGPDHSCFSVMSSHMCLSRWIKAMLAAAGIDTRQFASHSTHTASCTAAANTGVVLTTINEGSRMVQRMNFY